MGVSGEGVDRRSPKVFCVCICLFLCIFVYLCVYVYVCMCLWMYVCVYVSVMYVGCPCFACVFVCLGGVQILCDPLRGWGGHQKDLERS